MAASYIPKGLQSKADALLASIVPHYTVMPDGGLASSGFGMKLYEDALFQLLNVEPSRLTPAEFHLNAREALTATIRGQDPSFKTFNEHLDSEIKAFRKRPRLPFRICSRCHFSVPQDYELNLDLWDARLSISQRPPKGLSADQPELQDGRIAFADPAIGAYLTMTVYERTKGGALDHATKDIGFLLGLLNFTLNLGSLKFSLFSANERQVEAKIFPGREVLLLKEDGTADVDRWSFYRVHPPRSQNLTKAEITRLADHAKIIEQLNKRTEGDRNFYRAFFELYFDALCEVDSDIVVMRLWKAAEHLTRGQKTQHIANRLAITWDDKAAVSAVCYALGQRRNLTMHDIHPILRIESLPETFRHFLENLAWKSLGSDIKSVAHWKTLMHMSDTDIDLDLAADAVEILKALR